jgi:ELWxxDGT repeat protein
MIMTSNRFIRKFYWIVFVVIITSVNAVNGQIFSLLKDINVGSAGSSASNLTAINGQLFFSAEDGINGREVWKTNGTEAGTILVKDINPGAGSSLPSEFINANGIIYFVADDGVHGTELWKSDGSAGGTAMVKDILAGATGSTPSYFVRVNGAIFFIADDGIHGRELWKTDGTENGTLMIKDINAGAASATPWSLTEMNGLLYFSATDGGPGGSALWKTDGTEAGTLPIKYVSIVQIRNINNSIFFSGSGDPAHALWKSDGTTAGTAMLKNTGPISSLTDVNGIAFFFTIGLHSAITIWKSDGTTAGTESLVVIPSSASTYTIGYFTNVNGRLFFVGPQPSGGTELWQSDGTTSGTTIVKDIYPGVSGSEPINLTNINGELFFRATNGTNGKEIWKSNSTDAGTVMVQDIAIPGDGMPAEFVVAGSKLFVSVIDNMHGRELWVADLNLNSALPLTLSNLKGRLSGNDGVLDWTTSSEQNTSHFEIERSTDRKNFTKAGTVTAAGNSSVEKQYAYTDRNITSLGAAVVYYRLKMMDIDNKFSYSRIVAVNINAKEAVVMLYPNPVRENTTLMISVIKKEKMSYKFIDQNGRTVQQKNITVNEGSNSIIIPTNSLVAGMYTIVLTGNDTNSYLKFVKQ